MKRNIKGLDHYFEAARNQAPVLSLEEVRTLIRQPAAALGKPGKEAIKQTASIQKMLLTSHVLTVIATVLACWSGMASGNAMEQEEIRNRRSAVSANAQEQVVAADAGKQVRQVRQEAAPGKNGSGAVPVVKELALVRPVAAIQQKARSRVPAAPLPLAADELKPVAEPVRASAITPLGRVAVKAGHTSKVTSPGRKPAGWVQVSAPIAFVEVDTETAKKLGFTLNEQGIRFEMDAPLGIEHITKRQPNRLRIEVSNHVHVMSVTIPPGAKTNEGKVITQTVTRQLKSYAVVPGRKFQVKSPAHPYPLCITDTAGKQRIRYKLGNEDQRKWEPAYFNKIINSLVPVLVKANNAANDQAIFWFERSDAFLAALPAGQREALRPESKKTKQRRHQPENLPAYKMKETGEPKPVDEKEAVLQAEPDLLDSRTGDLVRNGVHAVQDFTVYPNPAYDRVKMDVRFRQPEVVTIYLADIWGKPVKVLRTMQQATALACRYQFDLSGIAPGMYVVVMQTKSGQTFAQRLIIQ